MILSEIHKYGKPIVIYGYIDNIYDELTIDNKKLFLSYEDIDYEYYPVIHSNESIREIKKGIILSNYSYDKYLSIYISKSENYKAQYTEHEIQWIQDCIEKKEWKNYFNLNVKNIFELCLANLNKVFKNQYEYIHAYEQILKFYNVVKENYINHEESIYLLSCMIIKRQIELIDIDVNYVL